jgi:TniQ/Integrase core domain
VTVRPLPRSLDRLPDESLPGYVLRLAHRLDLAPGRIAQLTGQPAAPATARHPEDPAVRMLHLDTATAATFANATRLSALEVAGLCLDRLRSRYPPLDLDYQVITVRHRQASGIPGLARWVFTRSTRYCPQCLAGDGSSIQQAHGGAWQQLWRLPPIFVCTTHKRLPADQCPSCRQPVHSHRGNTALLPRLQDASLHPAQCRTTIGAGHWRALSACGARLDVTAPSTASAHQADPWLARLLAVQRNSSLAFGRRLTDTGLVTSMGTISDALDNAVAESFFATLDCELLDRYDWPTRQALRTAVFDFIEVFYSRQRRHSTLDYASPATYERQHTSAAPAA